MKTGVYPGSFDPVTLGHVDIIERGLKIVDKLVVGILNNSAKTPMFSLDERIRLMKTACEPYGDRVEIVAFSGPLVDFLKEQDSTKVIRGLRAVTDFEYELQMAQANRSLYPEMETIFLTTRAEYAYISSTVVKDVLRNGGDVSHFVPSSTLEMLYKFRR